MSTRAPDRKPPGPRATSAGPGDTPTVGSRAAMDAAIARLLQTDEAFRVPLLRAARDGALGFTQAEGGRAVPARFLKLGRPCLVILADDHPAATGPDAWPQARKLLRWARAAVFHAAGGRAEDYAMIAAATVAYGRLLLVEMEYRQMQAWGRLAERELPRLNLLRIEPKNGQHPIQGAPAGTVLQ